jgi:AcrR family transcriptional regulator
MASRELARVESESETETVELTPAQDRAVAALAGGATITAAAEAAGVSRPTVYAWLDGSPEFVAELNRVRAEARSAIRAELQRVATSAVATLRELVESPKIPSAIRLRAALAVLSAVGADGPELIGSTDPAEVRSRFNDRDLMRMIGP